MYTYKINNSYTVYVNHAYYNECKTKTKSSSYKSVPPASYNGTTYVTNKYPEKTTYTKPHSIRRTASNSIPKVEKKEQISQPLINVKVSHKVYGTGAIVDFDKAGHIFVSFGKTIKQFVYPSAFQQGFLAYV